MTSQFYLNFWRSNLISCERDCARTREIAILLQFLASEPHFVRKGRSNLISCESVAFRGVSLALPRAFKREIEKKEGARGQESKRAREQEGKRARENVKMRRCEDAQM